MVKVGMMSILRMMTEKLSGELSIERPLESGGRGSSDVVCLERLMNWLRERLVVSTRSLVNPRDVPGR